MKRRRRSLRISQDLETCGENFGSVWKEPSPESCRVSELKEKRRRSRILNAEELLPFKATETSEVEPLNFLNIDIQTTPLSEIERARCPDGSFVHQENLGITPVNISEDVKNPSTERFSIIDDSPKSSITTPLPKIHPEVFSTPVATPHLSDFIPYSPSQPILADISQPQETSTLVSPSSPASDVEFFTPMSQVKSHPSRNDFLSSSKKSGTKFRPKHLAAEYSKVDEKMSGTINQGTLGDSAANFAKICKSLGEKLVMLNKANSSEEKATGTLADITEEDVGFERCEGSKETEQSAKTCLSLSSRTIDTNVKVTESPQKNFDSCAVIKTFNEHIFQNEQNKEPLEHLPKSHDKNAGKDFCSTRFIAVDETACLTPDLCGHSEAYVGSPERNQDHKNNKTEEKSKTRHDKVKNVDMQDITVRKKGKNLSLASKQKIQPQKRGRPRKMSTDSQTSDVLKQVVPENLKEKINLINTVESITSSRVVNLPDMSNYEVHNVMQNQNIGTNLVDQSQLHILDMQQLVCNEPEATADDVRTLKGENFPTVLKRCRGRPRKKSSDSKSYSSVETGGNSPSITEYDVKECKDGQQQEELSTKERTSKQVQRKSTEICTVSVEEPCKMNVKECSLTESILDFNSSQIQEELIPKGKKPRLSRKKSLEAVNGSKEESYKRNVEVSLTETGHMECQHSQQQEELKAREEKPRQSRRKSIETLKDSEEEPSKTDLEEDSPTKNGNLECGNSQQQEELLAAERKTRRLRRRSLEIYKASREELSKVEQNEEINTEETKDFGNVLKDLNGTTAPAKAPRKRKKTDTEEDIVKIYTSKNYVPPPIKALETISESPTIAKQARKLKRMIEFGSLYHVPPIKQKKRQQKAVKRGWDQRKLRKNKISDDVAQQKLQSIWDELDKD